MTDEPLDLANRVAITVLAMLVIFAALLLVLLWWGATDGTIGRVEDFAGWLRDHDGTSGKFVVSMLATVVVLLMLAVIVVELTPSPTQKMRVRPVTAGDATLTTAEIAARVEDEVRAVPQVAAVSAIVAARGKRVEVVLDLQVASEAALAQTADEACRRTESLIKDRIGIELAARPRARLRYRELDLRRPPAAARAEPPPPRPSTGWERPLEGTHDQRSPGEPAEETRGTEADRTA